jgi:hypothetical protein
VFSLLYRDLNDEEQPRPRGHGAEGDLLARYARWFLGATNILVDRGGRSDYHQQNSG